MYNVYSTYIVQLYNNNAKALLCFIIHSANSVDVTHFTTVNLTLLHILNGLDQRKKTMSRDYTYCTVCIYTYSTGYSNIHYTV